MMTRGRGGVWIPPKSDDVIYEQPLRVIQHLYKDLDQRELLVAILVVVDLAIPLSTS